MSLSERRKKLIIFLILCLIVVGVFIFIIGKNNKTEAVAYSLCPGCGEGTYTSPTCVSKGSCYVCGYTKPATGHSFPVFQTCEGAVFCSKCGYRKEGPDHNWKDADCENPKTCLRCGKIEGTALGHNYEVIGVDSMRPTLHILMCTRSGCMTESREAHDWEIKDCTNKTCSKCGYEMPGTAVHDYSVIEKDSQYHWKKCSKCENIDSGSKEAHTYGTDGKCTVCGETKTSGGNPGGGGGRKSNNL